MNQLKYGAAWASAVIRGGLSRINKAERGTRVLMLHDIGANVTHHDPYTLPPKSFRDGFVRLRQWADLTGTNFVPFSGTPSAGVAVTFDDGYQSTLRIAAELLVQLSIPFHVFVTRDFVEGLNPRYLRRQDVALLSTLPGVSIGIHGVTHSRFSKLDDVSLLGELRDCQAWLEDLTGVSVSTLSYPHGDFDERVTQLVQTTGVMAAACSSAGTFTNTDTRYSIPRIDIWSLDSPNTIVAKVRGCWDHILP